MEIQYGIRADMDTDYTAEMLLKDVLETDFGLAGGPHAKVYNIALQNSIVFSKIP